jgi:hypothetical protein
VSAIPSYSTPYQTPLTTTDANRLLKFVTDVDSTALTFVKASNPANGAVSAFDAATGGFTYTPNAGFAGSDSFTFTVSDGTTTVGPRTVTIVVGEWINGLLGRGVSLVRRRKGKLSHLC